MASEKDYLKTVKGKSGKQPQLPAVAVQIKTDALLILEARLSELFSNCDDLFFDLSNRAATNNEQNLYFEAMRDVRVKAPGVVNSFKQLYEQLYIDLNNGIKKKPPSEGSETDTLSLVQEDELEEEVAITGMVSKSRIRCQEQLYQLVTRLDYLMSNIEVTEDNNPLDPQQLCSIFAEACESLQINIKAQIIVYKQFERVVISQLSGLYSTANQLLINAGVLPKIKYRSTKKPGANTPDGNTEEGAPPLATNLQPNQQVGFDFNELTGLLAGMRKYGLSAIPNYMSYTANPGTVLPRTELVDLLTELQPQAYQASLDSGDITAKLHNIVGQILASRGKDPARALKQADEDVINLVAMFFDFVLDDDGLPLHAQALISRLQIPIVKLALKDSTFFSNNDHPARKLINTIAQAAIGWESEQHPDKDLLYKKISESVQTINEQYINDESIILATLQNLVEFIDKEMHKASLVEKRTSQQVEGQAKSQHARQKAQRLLFEKLEKSKLPSEVHTFLCDRWLNYLVLTTLRQGEDSQDWIEAEQLVDDLIWACQPHDDSKSHERQKNLIPNIIERVRFGLKSISDSEDAAEAEAQSLKTILDEINNADRNDINAVKVGLSPDQAEILGHTPGSGSKSWKEMTALERQDVRYKALTYEFLKTVDEMPIGTWLLFEDKNSKTSIRCKLATKIDTTDSFVFVNKLGFKALEKTRKDFAFDLQQGIVKILDTGPLFDRALANIAANLRKLSK